MTATHSKKILIGMPAYNEGPVIGQVIDSIKAQGYQSIVVCNDGSKDTTAQIARSHGATVISHKINRGAGAATATLIAYARRIGADYLVLLDSDGQHSPKDIARLLHVASKYNVVIGSRNVFDSQMPFTRKFLNFGGSIMTFLFFGRFVFDSQSGFKVFDTKALSTISITYDTYEFCSQIIGEIAKHNLLVKEVPIAVIYTQHSKKKGQNFWNGLKMLFRFLIND
jgi:polyprenyl-phospho-N-acetylgalactosaminyl synthase